ncbi:chalcone isomerase family protein [Desulfopila aestuarii]|uniref:Chalcone isomerase-like n=1 Tax=Desulfopila aestuarii DSM 18488 TaxID=1121416 RepID=A0A1M7Y6H2_9BACT|nr:chalcone isomerase family protein [Desulfopila aestuarii]SHO48232.1 Chalcone isomerase-like [Desulfopila aestuarii DSM 18488]
MKRAILMVFCLLLWVGPAFALEVAGVSLAEKIQAADGTELTLNGAGIRSKLFFKIYVAGLYLQNPAKDTTAVLADSGQKQMLMHFLYDKVEKDKLVAAWNEGFEGNLSKEALETLADRIGKFNAMFTDVKKDDTIVLEYIPEKGTSVTVAGEMKGVVEGKDFSDALFSIWLGKKPVTEDLKKALLSQKS